MLIYSGERVACFEHSNFFKVKALATRCMHPVKSTHNLAKKWWAIRDRQQAHEPHEGPYNRAGAGSSSTRTTRDPDRPDDSKVQLRAF